MPNSARLLSLDVMRGATILAMILVNNPGDWGALYWPLGHADWHGWTPTDLVFPFFLFMVGVAMAYSLAKYTSGGGEVTAAVWQRIARRVVVLLLLGLLLNGAGNLFDLLLGKSSDLGLATLRWPGVLQRIALAYLAATLIVLHLDIRWQIVMAMTLLFGYAALLTFLPADVTPAARLDPESNFVRAVDVAVIGEDHMWTRAQSRPTDPEGLLSTLPAIVTTLTGYWAGLFIRRSEPGGKQAAGLIGLGLLLATVGQLGGLTVMPINKALWTPTFVALTSGLAMVALSFCLLLFDVFGKQLAWVRQSATAFSLVGVNAILAFVASGVFARFLITLEIGDQPVKEFVYQRAFVQPLATIGLTDPRLASLAYAAAFVVFWWLILWGLHRRSWTLRV